MNPKRKTPPKPARTIEGQIEILRKRGMVIADEVRPGNALEHLNYYRLSGYWMSFKLPDGGEEAFRSGTTFESVVELYEFDRSLRLTITDAIERFEISLRTRWAYVLGHRAGPNAHREAELFKKSHPRLLEDIEKIYKKTKNTFLKHYLAKDEEPPIWALCEVLTLSNLSKWLSSLKNHRDRQAIADPYGLHETPFCSFVHHLAYIRNVCAHHNQLLNSPLTVLFKLPENPRELAEQLQRDPARAKRLYNTLTLLAWLMGTIKPGSTWAGEIRQLIASREDLCEDMGFPQGWKRFKLWREDPP